MDESTYTDEEERYKEFDCDICGGTIGYVYDKDWEDRKLVRNCNCG